MCVVAAVVVAVVDDDDTDGVVDVDGNTDDDAPAVGRRGSSEKPNSTVSSRSCGAALALACDTENVKRAGDPGAQKMRGTAGSGDALSSEPTAAVRKSASAADSEGATRASVVRLAGSAPTASCRLSSNAALAGPACKVAARSLADQLLLPLGASASDSAA